MTGEGSNKGEERHEEHKVNFNSLSIVYQPQQTSEQCVFGRMYNFY